MVYEYNWIILSLKKRLIACNNMNETRENHAKWNKPERKKILCDFTFIWNLKILKQRVDEWLLAVGRWRKWGDVGSVQFSSDTQSCPTLGDPMNCSMPGLPVYHQLLEFRRVLFRSAHEFGWTLGVGDRQGGLACCNSWGHKESDTTEELTRSEERRVGKEC